MAIDGDHPTGGTTPRLPIAAAPLALSVAARRLLLAGAALWLVGVAYGVNQLRHFESTPGVSGITPGVWPAMSALRPQSGRSTLIMMVHPQCSCTRFGALTSGHTVVYDPSGRLLFSGGITSARGHAGENMGSELILAQLARKTNPQTHAVFGCPLADSPVSAQL
jgi:hypothetical protein